MTLLVLALVLAAVLILLAVIDDDATCGIRVPPRRVVVVGWGGAEGSRVFILKFVSMMEMDFGIVGAVAGIGLWLCFFLKKKG